MRHGGLKIEIVPDYTITMFSDLTKKVTLQNLFHDGGFSNMGVSEPVMDKFVDQE